jgi:hypothetical protein
MRIYHKFSCLIKISVFLLAFLFTSTAQSQEGEKYEKVIATGVGSDFEKAKQNAVRNAIEQVIGTYVTSDTIVKNSILINDNVLAYSAGYVKESKVILQKRNSDGLFSVKIETLVVATHVKRKLESLNIATRKIEGGTLFSESISRIEEQKSAGDLLNRIISKYPQAAYVIEIGKPEITSTNSSSNKANVTIPLTFRWDSSFLGELGDILSRVSKEQFKLTSLLLNRETPIRKHLRDNNKILCIAKKAVLKSGKADVCWALQVKREESGGYSLLNLPVSAQNMTLTVSFKDKEGNIMESATYAMGFEDSDTPQKQGFSIRRDTPDDAASVFSLMQPDGFAPPNILGGRISWILLIADGVFNVNVKAEIGMKNLNNISSMEVHLDPWKN